MKNLKLIRMVVTAELFHCKPGRWGESYPPERSCTRNLWCEPDSMQEAAKNHSQFGPHSESQSDEL